MRNCSPGPILVPACEVSDVTDSLGFVGAPSATAGNAAIAAATESTAIKVLLIRNSLEP
jgi:hypothetical protein